MKPTTRQSAILEYIQQHGSGTNRSIIGHLTKQFNTISRVTIARDLALLCQQGLIQKQGKGRSVTYSEILQTPLVRYIDVEKYFTQEIDQRSIACERFDFAIFGQLTNIFTKQELTQLTDWNKTHQKQKERLSVTLRRKELERLTIELSWKSSQIEGNTYSLLDTEQLITGHETAPGHPPAEATMILNHKRALDYIVAQTKHFQTLRVHDIEDIHRLLMENLVRQFGLRSQVVGITGTRYQPLDNVHQIREALEKLVQHINAVNDPFTKALIAMVMLAYIHPFEDGNKRTSRLIGNALLLAHDICPLSFRSINEAEYKKAIVAFYEQHSLRYFKELFMEQFHFSVEHYFL